MTGQLPISHVRGITRSRLLAIAFLMSITAVAIGFVSPASAAADCAAPSANKTFAADITPHTVAAGTLGQQFTLKLCNDSPTTTTQQLGSVNLTPPQGFTARSVGLPGCSTPIGQSGATCGDVVNNVVQIRNIKLQPGNSVLFTLTADVPAECRDDYEWVIKGRQSNNHQGAKNDMSLDRLDSDLKTSVGSCSSGDLSVSQAYNQEPQTAGNNAVDSITVSNSGTSQSSVSLQITLSGGATFATFPDNKPPSVSGTNWSCSTASSTQATCNHGTLGTGSAPVVTVHIATPASAGSVTCGAETGTGICTTASVTGSEPDPDTADNSSSELLTLTPQGEGVARGTVTSAGATVTTGSCVGTACFAMTFTFPPNAAITVPYVHTATRDLPPGSFCGAGISCDVSLLSDDIKLSYTSITLEIVTGPELTPPGVGTPWTIWSEGQVTPVQFPLCSESGSGKCVISITRDAQQRLHVLLSLPGGDPRIGEKCYLSCSP